MKIELYNVDCLEKMKDIPDKSVDMILADLPYQTTACKWDILIPFEPLWKEYKRIIKDNGAIVLTASQPFTSALVMSNVKMFKYEWIWDKRRPSNPMLAKISPLKYHENILVFGYGKLKYNPQGIIKNDRYRGGSKPTKTELGYGDKLRGNYKQDYYNYPKSLLLGLHEDNKNNLHPTQKPVALFEYLIKTYTNEGDTVLDNVMGSGTCGVACKNLNRNFIGIEINEQYFKIAKERIENVPESLFNPPRPEVWQINKMTPQERLKIADYILSSDAGFESDCVKVDIYNGKKVSEREKILAELVGRLYCLIHPAFNKCKHPDWEKENEILLTNLRKVDK